MILYVVIQSHYCYVDCNQYNISYLIFLSYIDVSVKLNPLNHTGSINYHEMHSGIVVYGKVVT